MTEERKGVEELGRLLSAASRDGGSLEALRERVRAGGLEAIATTKGPQQAMKDRILALALEHPDWGCARLSDQLKAENAGSLSSPTVQALLIKHGLGGKAERVAALEAAYLADGRALTPEQETLIARANPAFRERHDRPSRPGELLVQECFMVGNLARLGAIYLHAAVDAYSGLAFAFCYPGKRPECAVSVLHNDVMPYYESRGLPVKALLTDAGWEYGRDPFAFYLRLHGIEHRVTSTRGADKHGVFERFHGLAKDFCAAAKAAPPYESLEALQADCDRWTAAYNAGPLPGYPTRGASPEATHAAYLSNTPPIRGRLSSGPPNWPIVKGPSTARWEG